MFRYLLFWLMCNGIAVQWQLCLGEEHATTTSVEILWPTNTSTISTTTTIPFDEPLLVSESKRYNIIDGQLCLDTNEQSTNQTSDESGNSNSGNRLLANCPHSDFGQKIASHISPSIFNITNKIIAPQSGNAKTSPNGEITVINGKAVTSILYEQERTPIVPLYEQLTASTSRLVAKFSNEDVRNNKNDSANNVFGAKTKSSTNKKNDSKESEENEDEENDDDDNDEEEEQEHSKNSAMTSGRTTKRPTTTQTYKPSKSENGDNVRKQQQQTSLYGNKNRISRPTIGTTSTTTTISTPTTSATTEPYSNVHYGSKLNNGKSRTMASSGTSSSSATNGDKKKSMSSKRPSSTGKIYTTIGTSSSTTVRPTTITTSTASTKSLSTKNEDSRNRIEFLKNRYNKGTNKNQSKSSTGQTMATTTTTTMSPIIHHRNTTVKPMLFTTAVTVDKNESKGFKPSIGFKSEPIDKGERGGSGGKPFAKWRGYSRGSMPTTPIKKPTVVPIVSTSTTTTTPTPSPEIMREIFPGTEYSKNQQIPEPGNVRYTDSRLPTTSQSVNPDDNDDYFKHYKFIYPKPTNLFDNFDEEFFKYRTMNLSSKINDNVDKQSPNEDFIPSYFHQQHHYEPKEPEQEQQNRYQQNQYQLQHQYQPQQPNHHYHQQQQQHQPIQPEQKFANNLENTAYFHRIPANMDQGALQTTTTTTTTTTQAPEVVVTIENRYIYYRNGTTLHKPISLVERHPSPSPLLPTLPAILPSQKPTYLPNVVAKIRIPPTEQFGTANSNVGNEGIGEDSAGKSNHSEMYFYYEHLNPHKDSNPMRENLMEFRRLPGNPVTPIPVVNVGHQHHSNSDSEFVRLNKFNIQNSFSRQPNSDQPLQQTNVHHGDVQSHHSQKTHQQSHPPHHHKHHHHLHLTHHPHSHQKTQRIPIPHEPKTIHPYPHVSFMSKPTEQTHTEYKPMTVVRHYFNTYSGRQVAPEQPDTVSNVDFSPYTGSLLVRPLSAPILNTNVEIPSHGANMEQMKMFDLTKTRIKPNMQIGLISNRPNEQREVLSADVRPVEYATSLVHDVGSPLNLQLLPETTKIPLQYGLIEEDSSQLSSPAALHFGIPKETMANYQPNNNVNVPFDVPIGEVNVDGHSLLTNRLLHPTPLLTLDSNIYKSKKPFFFARNIAGLRGKGGVPIRHQHQQHQHHHHQHIIHPANIMNDMSESNANELVLKVPTPDPFEEYYSDRMIPFNSMDDFSGFWPSPSTQIPTIQSEKNPGDVTGKNGGSKLYDLSFNTLFNAAASDKANFTENWLNDPLSSLTSDLDKLSNVLPVTIMNKIKSQSIKKDHEKKGTILRPVSVAVPTAPYSTTIPVYNADAYSQLSKLHQTRSKRNQRVLDNLKVIFKTFNKMYGTNRLAKIENH